ncbi:hypothetical protein BDR26DRAFT_420260 [Obelidium mucronatum]|nr:hypothetical protein BDR26DRAFT_420260 [Obelidium mucronatum]
MRFQGPKRKSYKGNANDFYRPRLSVKHPTLSMSGDHTQGAQLSQEHLEQQNQQPINNSMAFVLDRRFSLPFLPGTAMPTSATESPIPTNVNMITAQMMQAQRYSSSQFSRRMSLPAGLMYQPSMTPVQSQTATSIARNPGLESFKMYGHVAGDLMLSSEFSSPQQVTPTFTPYGLPITSASTYNFENAFNELLLEKHLSQQYAVFSEHQGKPPQFVFGFQPQKQPKENSQVASGLDTIHETIQAPVPLPMPEFYSTSSPPPATNSPPAQQLSPVSTTVLQRSKDTISGKTQQKFKPTEAQLSTLVGVFEKNPFPSAALRTHLAEMLDIQPKQVRFWFQNRRATYKINGIYVVKPKKGKLGNTSGEVIQRGGGEGALAPISSDNPYFFVDASRKAMF